VPQFVSLNSLSAETELARENTGSGERDMRYFCTVSVAVRLGFWLFTSGVVLGLILGLQV
jgi:hypothetical protein